MVLAGPSTDSWLALQQVGPGLFPLLAVVVGL